MDVDVDAAGLHGQWYRTTAAGGFDDDNDAAAWVRVRGCITVMPLSSAMLCYAVCCIGWLVGWLGSGQGRVPDRVPQERVA